MVKMEHLNCFSCVNNLGNEVVYTQVSAYLAKLYFKEYLLYFSNLNLTVIEASPYPQGSYL